MRKKTFITLFFLSALFMSMRTHAQELNFVVTIDASQIPDIQPYLIEDMKNAMTNFLNNRNWTEDEYKPEERIKCNLVISLVSLPAQNVYQATAQVQSSRPIYGTTQETVMFNFFDKQFNFDLNPGQPLNYNENIFNSKLASLLSFYAHIILALDYDSFGKLSGSPYVEKALNISNVAREVGEGWASGDPNNRAALIENLNNQQLLPYREGWYAYHRMALDKYIKDPAAAREIMYEQLVIIQSVNRVKPYSVLLRNFFFSKKDELINVFKGADLPLKNKVINLLRELDPTNTEKYQVIMKN